MILSLFVSCVVCELTEYEFVALVKERGRAVLDLEEGATTAGILLRSITPHHPFSGIRLNPLRPRTATGLLMNFRKPEHKKTTLLHLNVQPHLRNLILIKAIAIETKCGNAHNMGSYVAPAGSTLQHAKCSILNTQTKSVSPS